jgi:Xaa-Pro aminopeptidase
MSDLEVDRARAEAQVDTVLPLSRYEDVARRAGIENPTSHDALHQLLQERAIEAIEVPRSFPIEAADFLRDAGYRVTFPAGSFFPEREQKSPAEVASIREVQGHAETAMDAAIGAIREARAEGDLLYQNGEPLTSGAVKRAIARVLMDCGCSARHTIVACGDQACDPHNQGSGPLRIGQPIILDIFPRSDSTGYYGDITRTVVKGRPTDRMRRLYEAVLEGQLLALDQIRADADGKAIHQAVLAKFEELGFHTGEVDGHMQGFFHGTGHGVGLEIHEPPRISKASGLLRAGHVVTVEPGLYYPGRGAVRIEDLVVVTESGCDNLTTYPKELEV